MSWFFIALIGPMLYACTNFIDKVLLEKYFKKGGVGTLLLFSSLASAVVLPFLFLIDRSVFDLDLIRIVTLSIVGILNAMVLWFYFIALKDEEASIVVVFYQLVPVYGAILGYFILGEVLSQMQIISMAIIILGTTAISFEIDSENKFRLRRKTILPMVAAGFCWALGSVLFKSVAIEENLVRSLFWEHLMLTLVGVILFTFVRTYRDSFIKAIRDNSKAILSLNFLNEGLYISGNIVVAFAYMLAPIGLVLLTESFQPIFVFAIGIILTIFFPKITTEKIHAKHVWQKIIAIIITGIGTYLLLMK
jgi:drug/metabolite transporter (DMT)-like permease